MKRISVELKIKMIVDVENNQNLDNIKDDFYFTDIEVNDGIKILYFKVIDGKIDDIQK